MKTRKDLMFAGVGAAVLALFAAGGAWATDFTLSADHADCIYRLGEKATFTPRR